MQAMRRCAGSAMPTGSTGATSASIRASSWPFAARMIVARTAQVEAPLETVRAPAVDAPTTTIPVRKHDPNQLVREGDYEASLVQQQAGKKIDDQPSIASVLTRPDPGVQLDTLVVGAGPAGMYLACELAKRGLNTAIVGLDAPLVNNYGVWLDEFKALGMEHTLECSWDRATCYFGEGKQMQLGRGYGRVSRRKLREHLLSICKQAGVKFLPGDVTSIQVNPDGFSSRVVTGDGVQLDAKIVTLAAGAAGGRFLQYEEGAPSVAAQTAYGIEAEVEGYEQAYPASEMLFMDFRRHHSGVWEDVAGRLQTGKHPNAGDGLWGTNGEIPSFLYAMPLGGNRVFLEETCLVAKPALPFAVLKRRLERRVKAMGIKVKHVHEEEWSYIPVGGPLPVGDQPIAAFGAAANLVHPATGFSVSRSFREASGVADQLATAIRSGKSVREATAQVWETLWPQEKRTQTSFHVFGMELLATLDLPSINAFFDTFFRLPGWMWRGYMASQLSSAQLIAFALLTFAIADVNIKSKLVSFLFTDPSGQYLMRAYLKRYGASEEAQEDGAIPRVAGAGQR